MATYFVISTGVVKLDVLAGLSCSIVWVTTLMSLSIITSLGPLRIFGEGWRYLGNLVFPLSFYIALTIDCVPILQWLYVFLAASGLVIGYYYTRRLFRRHQECLVDQEDAETFKEISSIKGNRVTAIPRVLLCGLIFQRERVFHEA
jgi:hypothetical protein